MYMDISVRGMCFSVYEGPLQSYKSQTERI